MSTKEKGRQSAAQSVFASEIFSHLRRAIKAALVNAALWQLLPYRFVESLIRRLRLGGA